MEYAYLNDSGYPLAWALGLLACCAALLGGALLLRHGRGWQRQTRTELLSLAQRFISQDQDARSLREVSKRHLTQSLQNRGQLHQLQRRLGDLEQRLSNSDVYRRAIGTARRGGALQRLVESGDLNPAEAHLIQIVHGPGRKSSSDRRPPPPPAPAKQRSRR